MLSIRLHDGDPGIFSTIREQIDKLEDEGLQCKVIPGVTSLLAAAAEMNLELTLPGITQTLIVTRAELRTPVPDRESISELSKHRSTLVFYLSVHLIENIIKELLQGGVYTRDTPAAVVYKASWEDQTIIRGTLDNITKKVRQAGIIKTALVIVGDVLAPNKYEFSKVYDAAFTHGYRKAT
jgi:precorrin-4/cobalt-precorrin-4 C11-methyltransferase